MPRSSSSSSKPILGRAMAILALPLTPISKAKGPISRKILLFKKRGAAGKRRLLSSSSPYGYKPHRHYNYAYVGEYQFSPSSSPLIAYPPGVSSWRRAAKKRGRSKARMLLASLLCGGDDLDVAVLDGLPRADDARALEWECDGGAYGEEEYACAEEEEEEEEAGDEEVDGRAERFIERFYEEMRLQRQRSLVQHLL